MLETASSAEWGFAALFLHLLCGFGFVPFPQYHREMTIAVLGSL